MPLISNVKGDNAMKRFSLWMSFLPILLAATVTSPARSQTLTQTFLAQSSTTIEASGTSGGPRASSCGFIANSPNQVLQVTEPFAPIDIKVQSTGDYTLMIEGPNGYSECVMAHDFGGGIIESPGVLNQGNYNIYIGDREGASHSFTLQIQR